MRASATLATATPTLGGLLAIHAMPWQACIPLALTGPATYICRTFLHYKLARKAIDKAHPTQIPAIMNAITGHHDRPARQRACLKRSRPSPGVR
jgi:hypothetical protein